MTLFDERSTVLETVRNVLLFYAGQFDGNEENLIADLVQAGVLKDPVTEHEEQVQARAEVVREAARALAQAEPAYAVEFLFDYADIIEGYMEGG